MEVDKEYNLKSILKAGPGEALGAVNTWEMTFYIPVGLPGKSDTGRRGFLTIKFVSLHQYAFQVKASKVRLP